MDVKGHQEIVRLVSGDNRLWFCRMCPRFTKVHAEAYRSKMTQCLGFP